MTEYRPTLRDIVSEMARDLGSKIGTASKRVSNSVRKKTTSAVHSMQTSTKRLPEYSRTARGITSDLSENIMDSLSDSYHNVTEFVKGFVHDGLEVLVFPYIVPSAHRLPSLEWAKKWRSSEWKYPWDGIQTGMGSGYQGHRVSRPDTKQYGGIFGTLTGLGLTVAEGLGYWYMARKGYPNILVLALPLATNAASGLYEYGASINQRLIQKHSQRS